MTAMVATKSTLTAPLIDATKLRGGVTMSASPPTVITSTVVSSAKEMFGNMRTPSALIAGAAVGLAFGEAPKLEGLAYAVYPLLAAATLGSELIAVVWSTAAVAMLEKSAPGLGSFTDTFELLEQHFKLEWAGCNVHFFGGLLSLAGMLGIRLFTEYGPGRLGKALALGVVYRTRGCRSGSAP